MKTALQIVKIVLAFVILWAFMTGASEREDGTFSAPYCFLCLAIVWASGYTIRAINRKIKTL